jgi:DNA-binding XRE family transcriptional regulator
MARVTSFIKNNLKEIRIRAGLERPQVSRDLLISKERLHAIESNNYQFSDQELFEFCVYYKCTPKKILKLDFTDFFKKYKNQLNDQINQNSN